MTASEHILWQRVKITENCKPIDSTTGMVSKRQQRSVDYKMQHLKKLSWTWIKQNCKFWNVMNKFAVNARRFLNIIFLAIFLKRWLREINVIIEYMIKFAARIMKSIVTTSVWLKNFFSAVKKPYVGSSNSRTRNYQCNRGASAMKMLSILLRSKRNRGNTSQTAAEFQRKQSLMDCSCTIQQWLPQSQKDVFVSLICRMWKW